MKVGDEIEDIEFALEFQKVMEVLDRSFNTKSKYIK